MAFLQTEMKDFPTFKVSSRVKKIIIFRNFQFLDD